MPLLKPPKSFTVNIKIIPLIVLLFICFCFAQCHKDKTPPSDNPYGLPNATQTGAGVFACRINGVNAIAKNDIYHIGGWMSVSRDTLRVFGSFGEKYFQVLSLGTIKKNRQIDTPYSFQDTLLTSFLYGADSTCLGISAGFGDILNANGIIIYSKIDTVNLIVSGIFNCRIPVPNCDTLHVTEGRFDITYHF